MYTLGKTVGQGGCGKCKKYYSLKYCKMVIEKKIVPNKSIRSTILNNDPFLNILQLIQFSNNQHEMERLLQKEAGFMTLLKLTRLECCVEIIDFIRDPPSIIMEYCEGGDLRKILDEKEIICHDKFVFIEQILRGIEKIHDFGIIHGDLKCSNLFLKKIYRENESETNQVKIGDFGLSEIGGGLVKGGTPGFLAPEIQLGKGGSFESDIYSLGKVMLEILTCWRMTEIQMIDESNFDINQKYFPRFLGDINFYACIKKCLSPYPNCRPKIKQIIFAFDTNVKMFTIPFNLTRQINTDRNNKVLEKYKIGDKVAIDNNNNRRASFEQKNARKKKKYKLRNKPIKKMNIDVERENNLKKKKNNIKVQLKQAIQRKEFYQNLPLDPNIVEKDPVPRRKMTPKVQIVKAQVVQRRKMTPKVQMVKAQVVQRRPKTPKVQMVRVRKKKEC